MVPAELETAVAAALGEYLDSVLLDPGATWKIRWQPWRRAIKAGPCCLPLGRRTQSGDRWPPLKMKAAWGWRLTWSRPARSCRPAVRLLLGQVLVVRDRAGSAAAGTRAARDWARVVTLQGEVFLGNGAVVAGQGRQNQQPDRAHAAHPGTAGNRWMKRPARLDEVQQKLKDAGRADLAGQRSREKELDGDLRQAASRAVEGQPGLPAGRPGDGAGAPEAGVPGPAGRRSGWADRKD